MRAMKVIDLFKNTSKIAEKGENIQVAQVNDVSVGNQ